MNNTSKKAECKPSKDVRIEKLDFQKVNREEIPYTIISTKVIQNIKHKDALAVWVYLSSLPPDWKINKSHLKSFFQIGARTLETIFSYLKRANLVDYKRERFSDGTLGPVVIHVLCGDRFNVNEPYISTGGSNSGPPAPSTPQNKGGVVPTTPQKTTAVDNHSSGSGTLQKKHNYKENKKNKININTSSNLFDLFWEAYPKKVSKRDAVKAWVKNNLDEKADLIISDINNRKRQNWLNTDKQYIPNPATYLNGEKWTDELFTAKKGDHNARQHAEAVWNYGKAIASGAQPYQNNQTIPSNTIDCETFFEISDDMGSKMGE